MACLNEKENELEKERRQDRPQEEGDLIDRRIKEKERLKREKDAAESSGSRSDRSDRHDKSEGERREKKRKDGGDPMKVDSDSDTAEREIYNKAAVKKKDLKEKEEEVVTEKKGLLESIMNKFHEWRGTEKTESDKSNKPKSTREQQEEYQRKVQEIMDLRRQEEAKAKGKGKGKGK